MILRRLGNKKKIAMEIQNYFPKHNTYIEPFFGAGGMFFNKPKSKYNIVNDLDSEVFNLFQVVSNNKSDLEEAVFNMPIHTDLLNHWKKNKETDPIKQALRFLMLSNFTLNGSGSQLRFMTNDTKQNILGLLDITNKKLFDVIFDNSCFRKFLNKLCFRGREADLRSSFIYCDPPYLGTTDNYSNSFNQDDSNDLFDCLIATGCDFAMSEFDNPFILDQAEKRGLNIIIIGERKNLKNRRTEILITNYVNAQTALF